MSSRSSLLICLATCCSAIAAEPSRRPIEEIIVTAQRIEEDASSVPIALNAYEETKLDDRHIVALADLQGFVPNLSYATTNVGDMTVSIRGVGSLVSVNDGESGVSLHLNEVPLPPGQPPIELYDIQRLEVLRGPQGTLYGRNATGGVINIISNRPNFDGVSGYLDVEGGDYDLFRARGALNVPINEWWAFRIAGLSLNRDGYTDNLAGGQVPGVAKDIDGRDLYSVRVSSTWRVGDGTELWALYERFDENDDRSLTHQLLCKTGLTPAAPSFGCEPGQFGLELRNPSANPVGMQNGVRGVIPLGARDASTGLTYRYPRPAIADLRAVHLDFEPEYKLKQNIWQLGVQHEVDWATFTLNGGYQKWTRHDAFDQDGGVGHVLGATTRNPSGLWPVSRIPDGVNGLSDPACNVEAGLAGTLGGCVLEPDLTRSFGYFDNDEQRKQWSGEIRMRTQLEGAMNYMLGMNYQHSESRTLESFFNNDNLDHVTRFGAALTGELLGIAPDSSIRFYPGFGAGEARGEFDSISGFGELYADLSDRLSLTLGLRYNRDKKKIADRSLGAAALDINSSGVFDGFLGDEPVWFRFVGFDPARQAALFDYYNATDAINAAGGDFGTAFAMGTVFELVEASQLIPIVPQLNEDRLIAGVPTRQTWNAWSGRAVLSWQVSDDAMIYGKYSRGYKPGGFNPGTVIAPFQFADSEDAVLTYDREDVNAFEVGAKTLILDGTLAFNLAAFYSDYDALQLAETGLESVSSGPVNTNVDADMFGAELEIQWRPQFAPRAQLELGYGWLDAEVRNLPPRVDPVDPTGGDPSLVLLNSWEFGFARFVAVADQVLPWVDESITTLQAWGPARAPAAQYPNGIPAWINRPFLDAKGVATFDGVPVDVSGNRLPEMPEHTLHLAASYTWEFASGTLTGRWDYYWQDSSYMTIFNRPSYRIDSWDQHNAMLVYESGDNRWSARAWVRNIEDDVQIAGGLRNNDPFFSVSEPRTYGASFRYNFGNL